MLVEYPNLTFHFGLRSGVSLGLPKTWAEIDVEGSNLAAAYIDLAAAAPEPRLGLQLFPVGPNPRDAYREAIDAAVAELDRPGYETLEKTERTIDCRPALVVRGQWVEPDSGETMQDLIAAVGVDELVYVIMGITPVGEAEPSMITFAGAMDSMRFLTTSAHEAAAEGQIPGDEPFLSFFDGDIGASLLIPRGWTPRQTEEFPLLLEATDVPVSPVHICFLRRAAGEASPEAFVQYAHQLYMEDGLALPAFELERIQPFRLDGEQAVAAYFTWREEATKTAVYQLDVLVRRPVAGEGPDSCEILICHGYIEASVRDVYLPVMESVISSLRFGMGQVG